MKILHKNGITLTELLVASILIGVVMLGVASFNVSILQFQKTSDITAILALKAMTAMNYLVKDAYTVTGERTDEGIVTDEAGSFQSICFRHNSAGGDPGSYADDQYTCYLFEVDNDTFSRCPVPTPIGNVPPDSVADCGNRNILFLTRSNTVWSISTDADGRTEYIDFTIDAIVDPANAEHPVKNPIYTLTTQVSPPALAR